MQQINDFAAAIGLFTDTTPKITLLLENIYQISVPQKLPVYFYLSGILPNPNLNPHAIHIGEASWVKQRNIILNRLQAAWGHSIRVFGRQTICKRVNRATGLEFQTENHMFVPLPGKYRYGLYHNNILVSLAVFSGMRKMRSERPYNSIEMLRFCHKSNLLIVGGLSKLINAMHMEWRPDDVMTYVDQNWSNGDKFTRVGFKPVATIRDAQTGLYSLKMIRKFKK